MRWKIFIFLAILLAMIPQKISAQNYAGWRFDVEIPAVRIIDAVNSNGEFDHRIYFSKLDRGNALLIVCHGYHDLHGNYGVVINSGASYDYVNEISRAIMHWIQQGKIDYRSFEGVILVTCHTGYAQRVSYIPELNMNLVTVNNHKGENGIVEGRDLFGNKVVRIFRRIDDLDVENTGKSRSATREESAQMFIP